MAYLYLYREPRLTLGEPGARTAPAPTTPVLTGPTSIERGTPGIYLVTNTSPGTTFSNWRFTGGGATLPRAGNNNLDGWGGIMVQSGIISVDIKDASGTQRRLAIGVTVTPRRWSENAQAVPLGRAGNGGLPAQPRLVGSSGFPSLGVSSVTERHTIQTNVVPGGPNTGFNWVEQAPVTWNTRAFTNQALYDQSHPFFRAHDPARRGRPLPNGRLEIGTIRQNVEAHEGVISPPPGAPPGYASHQQALLNHLRANPINPRVERDVSHTSRESNRDYGNRINRFVTNQIQAAKTASAPHPRDIFGGSMYFNYPFITSRSLRLLVGGRSADLTVTNPAGRTRWSSSNEPVATVDGNGTVRPRGPGNALIRVTNKDGDVDEIPVTVTR